MKYWRRYMLIPWPRRAQFFRLYLNNILKTILPPVPLHSFQIHQSLLLNRSHCCDVLGMFCICGFIASVCVAVSLSSLSVWLQCAVWLLLDIPTPSNTSAATSTRTPSCGVLPFLVPLQILLRSSFGTTIHMAKSGNVGYEASLFFPLTLCAALCETVNVHWAASLSS